MKDNVVEFLNIVIDMLGSTLRRCVAGEGEMQ